MFNIGGGEVLVILLIALIVLGPDKLPSAARQAGKFLGDFRRMSTGFQRELRDAMDLGDLDDLVRGTPTKPVSPGGPTPQPARPSAVDAPDRVGPDAGAPPATPGGGTSTSGAATNGATRNGSAGNGSAAATNGNGDAPAAVRPAVRKRSIEVDGPSASFD